MSNRPVLVLGPQRQVPLVRDALELLRAPPHAPVGLVSAGWEERELEHDELQDHVARPVFNLEVFGRVEEIYRRDPDLHRAVRTRHDRMRRLRRLYRIRLSHAVDAAREVLQEEIEADIAEPERAEAVQAVSAIDAHHLERLRDMHQEFWERWRPEERSWVVRHREDLRHRLSECVALCVAGGHVGILLNRLRLLGVLDLVPELPVIAWSAGAMALSGRVVLFHDSPPQGPGYVEVFEAGLGVIDGMVPLPHADSRLRLDDPNRVALVAQRFSPDSCAVLTGGEILEWAGDRWVARRQTRRLDVDGSLQEVPA